MVWYKLKGYDQLARNKVRKEQLLSQIAFKKAVDILMKNLDLSENSAINKINEESSKSNKTIRQISDMIVLANDLGIIQKSQKKHKREIAYASKTKLD